MMKNGKFRVIVSEPWDYDNGQGENSIDGRIVRVISSQAVIFQSDEPKEFKGQTPNLMDYAAGTDLGAFQWNVMANPAPLTWFDSDRDAMARDEKFYITVDGKNALEIDMDLLQKEFESIGNPSAPRTPNDYPQSIYVLKSGISSFNISSRRISGGKDRGTVSEIVWGNDGASSTTVTFENNRPAEKIPIYYNSTTISTNGGRTTATVPIFYIEMGRVVPRIAFKQGDNEGSIINEKIELSGSKVELSPVFLTDTEINMGVRDIASLLERNNSCSYLIDSLKFNGESIGFEVGLAWNEYDLNRGEPSIYEITAGGESTQATINLTAFSPVVTVTRSRDITDVGYYIEDYYSPAPLFEAQYQSLRENRTTMRTAEFDVLGRPYMIPIIHYKNAGSVIKISLTEIPKSSSYSPLEYKIGDQKIVLGREFSISAPSSSTILDITDMEGNVRGKIDFRQMNLPTLSPTLNIVTIDTPSMGVAFSTVIGDLNAIYNTIGINWQQGNQIQLDLGLTNDELNKVHIDPNIPSRILGLLEEHKDYKPNEYYMIIVSASNFNGFAHPSLSGNWFIIKNTYDSRIPAHELGHCNGLDEFAVNIGRVPSSNRNDSAGDVFQNNTTNVMGYSTTGLADALPLRDFHSWQIDLIRRNIVERMNK